MGTNILSPVSGFWKTTLKIILILQALQLIPRGDAKKISFYKHANSQGDKFDVDLTTSCYNFPGEWNDQITSVNTHNHCIEAFEHGNCQGRSERIAPGTPSHSNLGEFGFNDVISSTKLCPGSESGSTGSGDGSTNALWRSAVDEHNKYRRRHGVPDLRGDDHEVHRTAQKYAEYLASNDEFEHSGDSRYGENLAGSGGNTKEEAIRDSITRWYNEVKDYDYNRPGFSMNTGHFTAVVWKSTTHVGIGVAWNPKKNWYVVVANYSPPGNFGGQYEENVPRPLY